MKKTLLTFLIATTVAPTYPMGFARTAATKAAHALYWLSVLDTPLSTGYGFIKKIHAANEVDNNEYPYAQKYCRKQLDNLDLTHIKLLPASKSHAGLDSIFIEKPFLASIEQLHTASLENDVNTDLISTLKDRKKMLKGVLHHEANHIKNNDSARLGVLACLAPVMTHGGVLLARGLCGITVSSARFERTKRILSGMGKGFISKRIFCAESRVIEQQADDAIKDPQAIQGLSNYLKALDTQNTEFFSQNPTALKFYHYFPYIFDPMHPTIKTRVEKLDQRVCE